MPKPRSRFSSRTRVERDSLGEVKVPSDVYWGAQTQRSIKNFDICRDTERWPAEVIHSIAVIKKAAAQVNSELPENGLSAVKSRAIQLAAVEVITGKFDDQFPLSIYQTGSGTQTNMNVNEVIANRANELIKENNWGADEENPLVHPNDDVNRSQSSNDTIPTAMHISTILAYKKELLPAVEELKSTITAFANSNGRVIKIGRTHCMDATPLTIHDEFMAYRENLHSANVVVKHTIENLRHVPQGGTAVGTGLNAPPEFASDITHLIGNEIGENIKRHLDPFALISSHDGMVSVSGALNTLAAVLMKFANDIKFLASGPRCGIGELNLPANEPGSSIMPGKVNPTQAEALCMVCAQVMGYHSAVTIAGASGQLQLNTFKPLIVYNVLKSIKLLSASIKSMSRNCISGMTPNLDRIKEHVNNSLMLATALNTEIGYEKAAKCALKAHDEGKTLKEATIELGFLDENDFDRVVDPTKMVRFRK